MKLGIAGKSAIVCAASKGLGKGCALALAHEGVNVVISARGEEALAATAEEIRSETGVTVRAVATDVTTALGRAELLAACPNPDILINNAGGPPPGDFRLVCNVCRGRYLERHHFYHHLCRRCAEHNWEKRLQSADMAGMVAIAGI